jgi:drug/metabolite transporter (DMT)-like permease
VPNPPADTAWRTVALLAFVVLAWGLNWVVMKIVVQEVTPLWAVAMRTIIAAAMLGPALAVTGQLVLPRRGDVPVILVISLFHMVAFAALMTAGLKYVTAGRAIVLGYTTPLWVAPAAWIFLKEPIAPRQTVGIALGISGLLLLFDSKTFDWRNPNALLGNGLILLAAACWSVSIVYIRAHRWTATPFQLVLWQTLLAAAVLSVLAATFEGKPETDLSGKAMLALLYNGAIGTALGFWAMTVVNKKLPALSTSLGLLCTPVVGIGLSTLILSEPLDPKLAFSALTILGGIALGANIPARAARRSDPDKALAVQGSRDEASTKAAVQDI